MTKSILIAAALATFAATAPAEAGVVTSYIDQQEHVCATTPARVAGFIRVGNVTEQITVAARTDCAWVGGDTRTRVRTYSAAF